MRFSVISEIPGRTRLQLAGPVPEGDLDALMKLSTDIKGVTKVRVYGRIGQMAIEYDAPRRADVLGAHCARRWFLPTPLRAVFVVAGYMAFLRAAITAPLKTLSKFLIVMAMSAIGLNTDIVKLVRTGGKPIALGACCWVAIACVSLGMQHVIGIW